MFSFGRFALAIVPFAALAVPSASAPGTLRYKDVAPVLQKSCVPCHGASKPAHGLNLTSYAAIMKGDKSGRVVVPGKPAKSRLATVLHGKPQPMPPGDSLAAAQIKKIEAWIQAGARK